MDKEYELLGHGETPSNPWRKIHRSFTNKIQLTETTSSSSIVDNKSVQPIIPVTDSNAQQINDKHKKLDDSHPRFGPLFQQQRDMTEEAWKLHHDAKDKAWERVMYAEQGGRVPDETKEKILLAIRKVEREARQQYVADNFSGTDLDFRMMMIEDSCLFIHIAFMILGKFHKDIDRSNDPIFMGNESVNNISVWMEAMFYVGNQIPLVVLRVLIKQQFFQDWIREADWNPPVSDLRKLVLYEQLVLPELDNTKHKDQLRLGDKAENKPCDVLHALHNLVLGPALTDPSKDYKFGEYEGPLEFDLEANEEDALVEEIKFPSAVELEQVGIYIKKLKSGGPRSISFTNWYIWAYLYLPVFPVDVDIISVFRSLKTYEISNQQLGKRNRELSSYISLMSDIIQTPQDLSILQKKGIVGGHTNYAETLPGILRKLNSKDVKLTYALRNVRRLITNFSSPFIRYQTIINIVVILTTIQAVFAMLAYFKPPKAPS